MKQTGVSLRQVIVLAAAGLLAPAADLLPGLLAETVGATAWVTPVVMLPVVLLWGAMLGRLFREEGSGLFTVIRQRLGRVFGVGLTLLYIMWGIILLSEQLLRSANRMSTIYGGRSGEAAAILVLVLAVWMLWGKDGAIYRAGELFWLGAAVSLLGVLFMGFAQVEWRNLVPERGDWRSQPAGWLPYLNVWGSTVFAAALLRDVPRKHASVKRVFGWLVGISLGAAALIGVILGQTGAGLACHLSQPFLIAVQGLSLEGALARLEAPVAALWLLADFCRTALFLAALREVGGKRWGRWLSLLSAALAVVAGNWFSSLPGMKIGGLLLGFLLPFCLWVSTFLGGRSNGYATSCGQ